MLCLQQFVEHRNLQLQLCHLIASFLPYMYRSCHKPIIISHVLVISIHIAEILQKHIFQWSTTPSEHNSRNVRNRLPAKNDPAPPLGNFADIVYLKEQSFVHRIRDVLHFVSWGVTL